MVKIYLDDERTPQDPGEWVILRSVLELRRHIKIHGKPEYISFDHDLGGLEDGHDAAVWFIDWCMMNKIGPEEVEINVHSANPVGRDRILAAFESWRRFEEREKDL